MRRRYVLALGVLLLFVVLAVVLTPRIATWTLDRTFKGVADRNGPATRTAKAVEASLGAALIRGGPGESRTGDTQSGMLAFYESHPDIRDRDAGYFESWIAANGIAKLARDRHYQSKGWESSEALAWLPKENKIDAWGRPFCVYSLSQRTLVRSFGPDFADLPSCPTSASPVEEWPLGMESGRPRVLPSGALIVVQDWGVPRTTPR